MSVGWGVDTVWLKAVKTNDRERHQATKLDTEGV